MFVNQRVLLSKMDAKRRGANVTEEQKTLLLQFMEDNQRLISYKFSADFTYKNATILWQKLTDILNSWCKKGLEILAKSKYISKIYRKIK